MVGAFLGIKLTVFTIFTASIAGSIVGLSTVLVVWMKRTHRFMRRLADAQAARRGDGNRHRWSCVITRCPSASFSAAWRCSPCFSAINVPALVWEALVRVLANPVILRAAVVFFCSAFAFCWR